MSRPPPDSSKKPAQQAPPSAAKPTAQHSPIDTVAAQLVYDDLRRFCEARRSDIASIITRSQFLLVLTSSLYAAYFIARPSPMAFSLLEAIAALVMLPSVFILLQAGRPFEHFDHVQNVERHKREPEKVHISVLSEMEDIAIGLHDLNKQRGQLLCRSYQIWLISLLSATILVSLKYA